MIADISEEKKEEIKALVSSEQHLFFTPCGYTIEERRAIGEKLSLRCRREPILRPRRRTYITPPPKRFPPRWFPTPHSRLAEGGRRISPPYAPDGGELPPAAGEPMEMFADYDKGNGDIEDMGTDLRTLIIRFSSVNTESISDSILSHSSSG